MLGLTAETRVFVKTGTTDLRLAFEGLRALVINVPVLGRQRIVAEHEADGVWDCGLAEG